MAVRNCDSCGKPFEPVVANQGECTQCMIKPHKKDLLDITKEARMQDRSHYHFKEKACSFPGCGKIFQPTGACQKNCPEHLYKKINGKMSSESVKSSVAPAKDIKVPDGIIPGRSLRTFFDELAGCGCTALVFGTVKISIEKINS